MWGDSDTTTGAGVGTVANAGATMMVGGGGGGTRTMPSAVNREPGLRRQGTRKDETVREMVKRMTGVVIPPGT